MADLNRVFLMGRLTFDPELRRIPSGTAVVTLRMATSRSWKGNDGAKREETLFVDVEVWDRQAETACEYLRKGSSIHVEGSLKMDTWDDKTTGEKRSKIRVHADRVQFLDRREASQGGGGGGGYDDDPAPGREAPPRRSAPAPAPEPRAGGNGASRNYGPAPASGNGTPAPRRPAPSSAPEPLDDDEDIPF